MGYHPRSEFKLCAEALTRQIINRNENFTPPAIGGHDRSSYMKLTSTQNLLGRAGQLFLLFGMLSRNPEGKLTLEDSDGRVVLDMEDAVSLRSLLALTPRFQERDYSPRAAWSSLRASIRLRTPSASWLWVTLHQRSVRSHGEWLHLTVVDTAVGCMVIWTSLAEEPCLRRTR